MTAVNEAVFGRRQSTDVVSVAYAPVPGAGDWRGEVIVNAQRALQVGPRHGGVAHELALYLAHGLDHLSGADDGTAAERQRMRRRELRWLREERGWPLSGLVVEKERRR